MNEVEYVLRIILKARDELAGSLKKAREELRLFAAAADSNSSKINAFNKSIETMDKNVEGITNKFREWRAVIEGTAGDNAKSNKSFADLNKEIETGVKTTTRAAQSFEELRRKASATNQEVKDLHAEYKRGGADTDYLATRIKKLGNELESLSLKFKANSQASERAFDWSRKAKQLAADIIATDREITADLEANARKRAKAVEDAEERRVKAVERANDVISKEILAQIQREADAEKMRLSNVKRSNEAIGREIDQQIKDEEQAQKDHQKRLEDLEKKRVAIVKLNNAAVLREIDQQITAEEKAAKDHQNRLAEIERKRIATVKLNNAAISREIDQQITAEAKQSAERIKIAQAEVDARAAQVRAGQVRQSLSERRGRTVDPTLASDAKAAAAELKKLSTETKHDADLSRDLRIESEKLSSQLRQTERDADRSSGSFKNLNSWLEKNSGSVAGLDNTLRGVGWLAAAGFANQLITVLGGLAGELVAVAASAAQAASALGGIFVAGVGQALPVIGILGAALHQVMGVMDAFKQAQLERQTAFVQDATATRRTAAASDTLRNAQDSLNEAQRRVKDSQEGLTKARQDARQELKDLIQAENDAKLAAVGAALSQKEAQQALIAAQAKGDTEGIQRAQLALLQAQADAEQSITDKRRARQAAEKGRTGGVEGTEGVKNARRAVEDSQRAVDKAQRGIVSASRKADEAATGRQTAVAKLNYLLSLLSGSEVRLFKALEQLRSTYLRVIPTITDVIIDSFTKAVNKVNELIQMPKVVQTAQRLARTIAAQFDRIFNALTSDNMIDQFLRIAEAARKNLAPITTIIINLGKAFGNIAEEAGPAFSDLIEFVGKLVKRFENLTGSRKEMTDFFKAGEKNFESWIKLGLAVIQLFVALAGAGGVDSGLKSIDDATKAIDNLTAKVRDNRKGVGKFFEDARKITYEVVGVVATLATALHDAFTPKLVENFADLFKTVFIPALLNAVQFFGKITGYLIQISDSPIGKKFLQLGIAAFIVSKILGSTIGVIGQFISGLGAFFGPVFSFLGKLFPMLGRVSTLFRFMAPQMARAALVALGPWALLIGAIVLILAKLGLLDDLWREIKSGFNAFWKEVKPSVDKLVESFSDLWDAVSKGKGLFAVLHPLVSVLRTVLRAVIQVGGVFLRVFGRAIGRVVGGLIDILSGVIDFITGVFTGDWRKAWGGIRQVVGGIFRALGGILNAFPDLIFGVAKKIAPLFRKGIESLWDWLKGLPKRLGNIASQGAAAFVKAFNNVGGDIIKGIVSGLKATGGFAKDLANSFIDLLNGLLPNKLSIPGAPDINLPDNPIPHLRKGGVVPGTGRGDIVHAMLEPGEHVVTSAEVANAGGHAAIFALRRSLGGGGQGGSGRFQRGGRVSGSGGLTIDFEGGDLDDFQSQWRKFWNGLVVTARNGAAAIGKVFRDMRVATTRSADRMYRDIRSSLDDIEHSFEARGKKIVNTWADTWQSMKKVTNEGLFYIGHETNKALTTLGEKALHFHLTEPTKASNGKAGGGWIGNRGQRGRDRGFYPLGDGEAVLNWQHQSYVEPAMNAYYGHGLGTMFNRVRGYHAGGAGAAGFAGGRAGTDALFDGHPSNVVSGIIGLVRLLKKRFPGLMVTSTRDHGAVTSTGGLSDHPSGHAVDLASNDYGLMNRAAAYIKSSGIARRLKQGIHDPNLAINLGKTVDGPGFFASAWPQHLNHIHLAMVGALGNVADMMTSIARRVVSGADGGLKTMVQSALDKVRRTANKFIDEKSAAGMDVGMPGGPGTPAPRGLHRRWIIAGLRLAGVPVTEANIAAQYALDMGESGGDPKAVQKVHDINSVTGNLAQGIAQVIPPTFQTYKVKGHDDINNPVDNIAASANYQIAKYGHLVGHPGYARGGIIPGPEGSPVPILAHAQEWILNGGQVNRLASMLGTSRSSLRSMMGFYGGPEGAQGGLDLNEITPLSTKDVKGIDPRGLRKAIVALRAIGRNIDSAATGLGSAEIWSNYLDKSSAAFRRVTNRIRGRINRGGETTAFTGFLDGMDKLLGDNGVFAKLRTAIERS
jgi:phage-related protein